MTINSREMILVLTNLPEAAVAKRLADALIIGRLAACVNILAGCTSVYRWEGSIKSSTEVPMLIKTTRSAYARVEQEILAHHPYELPEIISVPVTAGLSAYLDWVAAETAAA